MTTVSAEEALAHVGSNQHVFVHGACAAPTHLLNALAERARSLSGVRVVHLHLEGPAPRLEPSLDGHLRHLALFIGANARQAVAEAAPTTSPRSWRRQPRELPDA